MKLKPIRRDPAGFRSTELRNARVLVGLVRDFEELVLRVLDGRVGRALARYEPAKPIRSAGEVFEAIDAVEGFLDGQPARVASVAIVSASVGHGRLWADKSLGRFGYTTGTPTTSHAKPFYLPVEQKMIDMYEAKVFSEIKGLTGAQATALKREILKGFSAGESVGQITRRVRGVTGSTMSKAVTIARTETLAAGNAAALERYRSVGVQRVEWVAALDERVCEECESLHGNVYDIGEEPDLPIHPNCRCTTVPVIEKE